MRKPPSATPTRTPAEIAQAADRFLAAKRIDLTHRRAEKPEYHPDLGSWLIAYPTSRAVALGEGTFGVFVNDDDITRIRLTPSR
ncbi:MAG TPA: hypothetical protein VM555_08810 [Tahibacter sp.]|nr:hypothetical protein [Tahibacter sp.]